MKKQIASLVLSTTVAGLATPAVAAGPDDKGQGFLTIYVDLCVKHVMGKDDIRARLEHAKAPKLSAEAAAKLLPGMQGDAWSIPFDKQIGNFVLVLPAGNKMCMLHAQRTNVAEVERLFKLMTSKAPAPLVARAAPIREINQGGVQGRVNAASWTEPGAAGKLQFTLTTSAADKTGGKALGIVAMVPNGPAK